MGRLPAARGTLAALVARMAPLMVARLTLILCLTLLAGCDRPTVPPPELRVGHAPHDHHAALFVAATYPDRVRTATGAHLRPIEPQRTYDLVQGERILARLRIERSVGGRGLGRRLAEDQLDLSFGGLPAMLVQIDRGAPVRLLSPAMSDGAGLVIACRHPIASWEELLAFARAAERPLRIGYKADLSVQNLLFEHRLKEAGIRYSHGLEASDAQINLVNLHGPSHLIPALQGGLIDGFVSMQPYLALAEASGAGRLVALLSGMSSLEPGRAYPCCVIAAREQAIAEQPEALAVFLELMRVATAFLEHAPDASADAVADWLGVSPAVERRSLPTTCFSMVRDQDWEEGTRFWLGALAASGHLTGTLGDLDPTTADLDRLYRLPRQGAAGRGE